MEDLVKLVGDSLSNKLSKKGIKGAKQLKRNNVIKKKSIQFYLVARKAVQGTVMCILTKSPGCRYIMSTGDYQKQIKCTRLSYSIDIITPKCPRKNTAAKNERKYTRIFFLEKNHQKVQVCQKMFLNTLGLKGDRVVRTALAKLNDSTTDICDNCGKHEPGNKKSEEISAPVISHIRGYNPCISHYRRFQGPSRLYILLEFTISSMHKDYCEKIPHLLVSYGYYQKKVKSINISFVKLVEEDCDSCELHSIHLKDVHSLKDADHHIVDSDRKKKKKTFTECSTTRISKAIGARSVYKAKKNREWESNEMVISVDMQKVIMLPRLAELNQAIFFKRLILFNETFARVGGKAKGKSIKSTGVLWHESIKGRSAEDVANTFIFFLSQNRDVNNFVFWGNNCSGQNKNWFLYVALVNEVNRTNGTTNEVTIKYFEPGHTFMSADSFHLAIEQGMRKKQHIQGFQDCRFSPS